eukprot:1049114-Pleurochrysis_carterae.AAC.1
MPLSQLGAVRCPSLTAQRLALFRLSRPGAWRCFAAHHPAPCAVPLLDTHRRRAPSLNAGAPCVFRLSQPGVLRCKRNAAERCVRESAATP